MGNLIAILDDCSRVVMVVDREQLIDHMTSTGWTVVHPRAHSTIWRAPGPAAWDRILTACKNAEAPEHISSLPKFASRPDLSAGDEQLFHLDEPRRMAEKLDAEALLAARFLARLRHRKATCWGGPVKSRLHRDGTVSYWSISSQAWARHAICVPEEDLAAMPAGERERVQRHLERRGARR